jgi:hypothetical protein
MVDNIEPIHFGDDTQMDGFDGEAQVVSNSGVIIALTPLTKALERKPLCMVVVHNNILQCNKQLQAHVGCQNL